jgi:signal transduction histidine kinase
MDHSLPRSGSPPAPEFSRTSRSKAEQRLWDDPVLRIAFLVVGLLLFYQLVVTLLQPVWLTPATDWLRALLAWLVLLMVVLLSAWFTRTDQSAALSWWFAGAGLLSYAVARTLWLVEDLFMFPNHVPFPSLANLFFALQYLFYLLALLLVPRVHSRILLVRDVLDACLLLGAALALSWYFLLAPLYQMSPESLLGKLVFLSYSAGDLAILFGLTVALLRNRQDEIARSILALLIAAIVCLVVADTWAAAILLNRSSYQTGSPPDLFWMAFSLLVPLASLVRFRLTQHAPTGVRPTSIQAANLGQQDLLAAIRSTSPVAAALLASVVLIIRAERLLTSALPHLAPLLIALGLVVLSLVRQGLAVMENERLRRDREAYLHETTAQMEVFLGVAAHELKNPLASMKLSLQGTQRRIHRSMQRETVGATDVAPLLEQVAQAEHQEERQVDRLDRLVNDLVDVSRVQAGMLELHLEPTDLATVVREAVEELRQVNPDRTLRLVLPEEQRVPVIADSPRLGQVVANYVTNAFKYSPADRPATVGLAVEGKEARVWVRDEGPGVPAKEHEHIWERFHRVQGIEVQSGSGVGLGLGLHISRTIIEQHHGQVGVESAPGEGSTFWFSLPLATPEPALEESETSAPETSSPPM